MVLPLQQPLQAEQYQQFDYLQRQEDCTPEAKWSEKAKVTSPVPSLQGSLKTAHGLILMQ